MPGPEAIWRLTRELVGWFVFLTSAGFGNPIPEEVMLVMAGVRSAALASDGAYGPWHWLIWPVALAGGVMADVVLYTLGRLVGPWLFETRLFRRLAPPEKRAKIHDNIHRYGFLIFTFGRLLPGLRTTLFLTAGSMRLSLVRFCLADGVGALFGGSLFFFLGFGLGHHFLDLFTSWEESLAPYKNILILALLLGVVGYLLYAFLRHPITTGDPEELPIIGHQIAVHMPGQDRSGEKPAVRPLAEAPPAEKEQQSPAG